MGHLLKDFLAMSKQKERQLNLHAHSKGYKIRSSECPTVKTCFINIFLYREYEINLKRKGKSYMDAHSLFGQSNDLKVKILGMGYVPDSGITMHVILPFLFPLNSLGFNAMTYRKEISIEPEALYQILGWIFSQPVRLLDFEIGITFFLIFVKTEHDFF